jgi:hypothetical protein
MTDETKVESTTSSRGAQWTTAGGILALAAQALTNGNGLLGGLTGNGGNVAANAATLAIAQKDSEIALLKAKVETRDEVSQVYAALRARDQAQDAVIAGIDKRVAAIEVAAPLREQIVEQKIDSYAKQTSEGLAALAATVASITKTVVPKDSICPEVMARYNSWTAPTTTTTTT